MSLVKFRNRSTLPLWPSMVDGFFNDEAFLTDAMFKSLPATNVEEKDDAYLIMMAVPGITKDDIKIEIDGNLLVVGAEVKTETNEEEKNYTRKEYSYNSFKRTFTLPENVNEEMIEANCKNGELILTVPKKEVVIKKTKQIEIS